MFPTAVLRLSPRACACSKQDYTFAENDGFDDNGKLNTNSTPRRSCVARIPRVVMASVRVRCVDAVCRNSKVPTQCAAVGKSAPQPAPGYAKFKHDSDGTWDCYRLGSAPPTPHTHALTQVHASTHARTHRHRNTRERARIHSHSHSGGDDYVPYPPANCRTVRHNRAARCLQTDACFVSIPGSRTVRPTSEYSQLPSRTKSGTVGAALCVVIPLGARVLSPTCSLVWFAFSDLENYQWTLLDSADPTVGVRLSYVLHRLAVAPFVPVVTSAQTLSLGTWPRQARRSRPAIWLLCITRSPAPPLPGPSPPPPPPPPPPARACGGMCAVVGAV